MLTKSTATLLLTSCMWMTISCRLLANETKCYIYNCLQCSDTDPYKCLQCAEGSFITSFNTCTLCSYHCQQCTESTCLKCSENFELIKVKDSDRKVCEPKESHNSIYWGLTVVAIAAVIILVAFLLYKFIFEKRRGVTHDPRFEDYVPAEKSIAVESSADANKHRVHLQTGTI